MIGMVVGPVTPMTCAMSIVVVPLALTVATLALVVIAPLASTFTRKVALVTFRLSTGMVGVPILPWTNRTPLLATATVPVLRPEVVLAMLLVQMAVPPFTNS